VISNAWLTEAAKRICWRRPRVMVECPWCGGFHDPARSHGPYSPARFCSHKCFSANKLAHSLALDVLDWTHFLGCEAGSFTWWWGRFRPGRSKDTAARGWERLKARIRKCIPSEAYEMVIYPEDDPMGTTHLRVRFNRLIHQWLALVFARQPVLEEELSEPDQELIAQFRKRSQYMDLYEKLDALAAMTGVA